MPTEAASHTALLDTNVLLLWLTGQVDISLFATWKRVQTFEPTDFVTLTELLRRFVNLLTTPHVLAEVSNFVDQAPLYRRAELIAVFKNFIATSTEHYEAATILTSLEEFPLLGLADTGLSYLSQKAVVVTTDFQLSGRIVALGGQAVNFNHLRGKRLLS